MAIAEKQRLGRAVAALVEPGQTVFIDGGTTNLELVRHLPLELSVTVITHSPVIAAALEPHKEIEVIVVGGGRFRHSMVSIGAVAPMRSVRWMPLVQSSLPMVRMLESRMPATSTLSGCELVQAVYHLCENNAGLRVKASPLSLSSDEVNRGVPAGDGSD